MYVMCLAIFSLFALLISLWFWIGTALLILGGLAVLAEQAGLL